MDSDNDSDLTDLSDLPPPNTPGRPLTPGRPSEGDQSQGPASKLAQPASPKPSKRLARKGRKESAESSQDASASAPPKRKLKIKARPANPDNEDASPESSAVAQQSTGRSGIKLKLGPRPQKQSSTTSAPDESTHQVKVSLTDSLRELGDEEEDEEEAAPTQRRKFARPVAGSKTGAEKDEESDLSPAPQSSLNEASSGKRKRLPRHSDSASLSSKKRRAALNREERPAGKDDFVGSEDSDDEMSDVATEESEAEEELEERSTAKRSKAKKTPVAPSKGNLTKAEQGSLKKKAGEIKDAAKAVLGSGSKKPSVAELNKMVAAKIRASAAATTTASAGAGLGSSSGGSSNPTTPATAQDASPAPRRKPMPPKPRGSDMWGSLVGSSRPSPRPPAAAPKEDNANKPPPASENKKKPGDNGTEQQASSNDPNKPRIAQAGVVGGTSSSLPRPLGTSSSASGSGAISSARGQASGSGRPGGGMTVRESTFTVHMTPGINGQHWDKEAYRRLRIEEKHRYRNPVVSAEDGSGLLNLLEDAEVLSSFEDEWRSLRISNRIKYPSVKYREYGAGLEYAKMLKESRQKAAGDPSSTSIDADHRANDSAAGSAPRVQTTTAA